MGRANPITGRKVRVLIVDDSSLIRTLLRTSLSVHPGIEVVGQAADGKEALTQIAALRPDVVTLDVEMPRLSGIGVLEAVSPRAPVAFLMFSTLTRAGAQVTLEALQKGAFDYITKPSQGFAGSADFRAQLHEKVLTAAAHKHLRRQAAATKSPTAAPTLPPTTQRGWLIAIGISCGGPPTLLKMLPAFPSDFAPILVTQHMPAEFTGSFARHLDNVCSMNAKEAEHQEPLQQGTIYVAPGDQHMRVARVGVKLNIQLDQGPKVTGHRPSADALFASIARTCPQRSIGVIMTGMGHDGAAGLAEMRQAGSWAVGQDENTSLVYGMPKEAARIGAVDHVVPLGKIPLAIAKLMERGPKRAPANV